jgi:predicted DNA-binding transcriptional regulator AlpA
MNLLTRGESATYCRVGLRTFDKHVAPNLTPVPIGRRVLFDQADLDAWLATQKAGASDSPKAEPSTSSVSRSTAGLSIGPQGLKILEKLQKRRLASTRTSSNANPSSAESCAVVVPIRSRSS